MALRKELFCLARVVAQVRAIFYVQIRSWYREGIKNVFLLQQSLSAPLTFSFFQNYVFLVDLFLGTFLYSRFSYYVMHYCPFPL